MSETPNIPKHLAQGVNQIEKARASNGCAQLTVRVDGHAITLHAPEREAGRDPLEVPSGQVQSRQAALKIRLMEISQEYGVPVEYQEDTIWQRSASTIPVAA